MDLAKDAPAARQGGRRLKPGITFLAFLGLASLTGCGPGPRAIPALDQRVIDRSLVEYPSGFELRRVATGLTAPTALAVDPSGNVLVAEGGIDGNDVRIWGFTPQGKRYPIYPTRTDALPTFGLGGQRFEILGPVGGMTVYEGRIYVSHHDAEGMGVITALDYWGGHRTIVSGLPARGEHGVGGIEMDRRNKRLFFGVGSVTNSGVVGPDDFAMGWVKDYPKAHDVPYKTLYLLGKRFNSANPFAGLFSGPDQAVTNPFQPFGVSNKHLIPGIPAGKPPKFTGGLFSVAPDGGDLRMEAHGIRRPRGLAFDDFGNMYFTNNGMELRGTRPIRDDPDSVLRWYSTAWYGWPDFTTDLRPVTDKRYQPPLTLIFNTGYPDGVTFVIDHAASDLTVRAPERTLAATFPSQSGAAGMEFVLSNTAGDAFKQFYGNALVALSGDRAPFATGGQPLKGPVGYKVALLNPDRNQTSDFIRNTREGPASSFGGTVDQLERPIDVAFSPDGSLYVLDFGRMRVKNGQEDVTDGTGQVFRLSPTPKPPPAPATAPATLPGAGDWAL